METSAAIKHSDINLLRKPIAVSMYRAPDKIILKGEHFLASTVFALVALMCLLTIILSDALTMHAMPMARILSPLFYFSNSDIKFYNVKFNILSMPCKPTETQDIQWNIMDRYYIQCLALRNIGSRTL
jgi:hypothetical protein